MTNQQKLLKLLTYYQDCYAHCEGSGCWDWGTLFNFNIGNGMCNAATRLRLGNLTNFIPAPNYQVANGYWFDFPKTFSTKYQRRAAIKVRINYMKKYLQP